LRCKTSATSMKKGGAARPFRPTQGKGNAVNATSIASRLAGDGLQQHLYAEPTAVAEECRYAGHSCWSDSDCCNESVRLICEWWTCRWA